VGHNWIWRAGDEGIYGKFTNQPGHIYSRTPDDGYFILPMDEYNYLDMILTQNEGNSWFQLPPMDFSARPGVVLKLSQNFRVCCNYVPDLKCLVTNNRGATWLTYDLAGGTEPNTFCRKPYPEVNISEAAAGMSEVWIRFQWGHGTHYFWCLDDLELSEAYNNELRLEDTRLYLSDLDAGIRDEGFYYMVPFSQVQNGVGGDTFESVIRNGGMAGQEDCRLNAQVFHNGTPVYSMDSPKRDIPPYRADTFAITTPFIPDGYGDYRMVVTAQQAQTEGMPANNVVTDTFYLTDSIFSMTDWDWETQVSSAAWSNGNNDGDCLGVRYDISQACEASSISCMIVQRKDFPLRSTQPGHDMVYGIFRWEEAEQDWVAAIGSEYTTITQEMINTWVTLPLLKDGQSELLKPGSYIAAIMTFHGSVQMVDGAYPPLTIGVDQSHPFSPLKSVCKLTTNETWLGISNDGPMIRLNIRESGAPAITDVVFNVDMTIPMAGGFFHPAAGDFVDVAGTFNNWAGSAQLADPEGDGIYTLTVPGLQTFQKIEYKYRINGDWETAEFPFGGRNRVYRVTYYNVLENIYNDGISLGMEEGSIPSNVRIYPNPASDQVQLMIENSVPSELNISLISLQGQTLFHKQAGRTLILQETIDLSAFAKGIYFLKVNGQAFKLMVR
jgi:hypothetical protein